MDVAKNFKVFLNKEIVAIVPIFPNATIDQIKSYFNKFLSLRGKTTNYSIQFYINKDNKLDIDSFDLSSVWDQFIDGYIILTNDENISFDVYTDGSCVKGYGGYGYVVIKEDNVESYCGEVPNDKKTNKSTNQVAELFAIYMAIKNTTGDMTIYTDSKYSIGCLSTWYLNWNKNGWKNAKGKPVKNSELIKSILKLLDNRNITFKHVKAHTGLSIYNSLADKLANEGRKNFI